MTRLVLVAAVALLLGGCYQSHELDDAGREDPRSLCARTGGHWGGGCGPWRCGPSVLTCVSMTCACPSASMVWDDRVGCVTSPLCGIHSG